jgi:hypothetical protein
MTRRTKSLVLLGVKLLVAAGLIVLVVNSRHMSGVKWKQLAANLQRWPCLLLALAMVGAVPFIGAARWNILLRCQGFELRFAKALHLNLVGTFFNCVGFGHVGGDVVKAYYVARAQQRGRRARAVYTVLFDRAIGLFSLFVLGAAVMTSNIVEVWSEQPLRITSNVMTGAVIVACVWFYFLKPEFDVEGAAGEGLLRSLLHAVRIHRTKYRALAAAILLSIAAHAAVIGALFFLGHFLGMREISLYRFVFYAIAGLTVSMFGPLMGVGFGQIAFAHLLEREWPGSGYRLGAFLATLYQLTVLSCNLLLGLPAFMALRAEIAEVRAEMQRDEAGMSQPQTKAD